MNDKLKKIIIRISPKWMINFEKDIYHNIIYHKYREKEYNFGSLNKDKTVYIIRKTEPGSGLMSEWFFVLNRIIQARNIGAVPVVYLSPHRYAGEKNLAFPIKNVWEYYWEQPSEITVNDAYRSNRVILSKGWPDYSFEFEELINDKTMLSAYSEAASIVSPRPIVVQHFFNRAPEQLVHKHLTIMGVVYRGSDFAKEKLAGHAIQPEVDQLLSLVKKKYIRWKPDLIFIKAEEAAVIARFGEVFGDKVICSTNRRFDGYHIKQKFEDLYEDKQYPTYENGLDYLSEIIMLSKCDYLVGALNTGTIASIIMNNQKYFDTEIVNMGRY